jgi:hypothetical protein
MERIERPELDIAFKLAFPKARDLTPDNRADFEPSFIMLVNDRWSSERGNMTRARKKTDRDRAYDLLIEALARGQGQIPPANERLPPMSPCLFEPLWRRIFIDGSISERTPDAAERAFRRVAKDLLRTDRISRRSG